MKFYRAGKIDFSYLESDQEIQPVEVVQLSHYKRLSYFVNILKKYHPTEIDRYLSELEFYYKSIVKEDYISINHFDVRTILSDFEFLKDKPDLTKLILNFLLQELQLEQKANWREDKLTVTLRNWLRGLLIPRYNNLLVLTKLIGREEAIKLFKIYRSDYRKATDNPDQEPFENLIQFKEKYFDGKQLDGTEVIYSDVINGKFFYKKTNCTWNEAVKDLPDKELRYYALCYGDFQGATFWNDSFILTMKHTVANDDGYCSCVLHDTREDWDLTHPPKEFWDKMNAE